MNKDEIQITSGLSRLSVRYSHVIFPYDTRALITIASNLGYNVGNNIPGVDLKQQAGSSIFANGNIAIKGSIVIDLNSEKQFIGVQGVPGKDVIEGFTNLLKHLEDTFGEDRTVMFYESHRTFLVNVPTNALTNLQKKTSKDVLVKEAKKVFGKDMGVYGFKLISGDTGADSSEYREVIGGPLLTDPTHTIEVRVLERSHSLEKVLKTFEASEQNVAALAGPLWK